MLLDAPSLLNVSNVMSAARGRAMKPGTYPATPHYKKRAPRQDAKAPREKARKGMACVLFFAAWCLCASSCSNFFTISLLGNAVCQAQLGGTGFPSGAWEPETWNSGHHVRDDASPDLTLR
jgi:hypothetical protein